MRKSLKRMVVFVLVLVMVVTQIAVLGATSSVAAAPPLEIGAERPSRGASDASMERALVSARSLVNIDDHVFTDFSYGSWESAEGAIWNFTWMGDGVFAFAVVTDDGVVQQFSISQSDGRTFGFAEISEDDAVSRALAFIRRANPGSYQFFTEPDSVHVSLHNREYQISFSARVNGHSFAAASVSVGIDKFTGEVTNYSTRNVDPTRFRFESVTNIISPSEAIAAHARHIGMTLEYRSVFDFNNNEISVFPAYRKNDAGARFISAIHGEVIEFAHDMGIGHVTDAAMGFASGAAPQAELAARNDATLAVNLTPAERTAVDQVAGFLTSEQAISKLFDAMGLSELDASAFDDQHISLNRDFFENDRFSYSVSMFRHLDWEAADDEVRGVFGSVDAATGRVTSFNIMYHGIPVSHDGPEMTEDQVLAEVVSFLRAIAPAEFARTRSEDIAHVFPMPVGGRFGSETVFNYVRVENGILFRDNGISASFNQVTGMITSFSLRWFDDVTFPSVAGVLSPQEALTNFVSENGSDTVYITTGEGNANLVYDFGFALIDPFTGASIDHSGNPWEVEVFTPDYSDVVGHWSEHFVLRLLESGVYNWSGSFEPDRVMTEAEFVHYIMLVAQPWVAHPSAQVFLAHRGIDFDVSESRQATRQVAVRIIVEYLGYARLAEQSRWFVYPFSDYISDEFKGFVTVAHMLGIVGGDAVNNFNPTSGITRAQAAVMLHNLILALSID
ncbi:MAG: S-layer homology domain-containing protein [Oscillospiraceae bacterium]|nr:S-layer homology domain-containing protein [Oscillospiraceae bacterium]